jgi:hypothetical protein
MAKLDIAAIAAELASGNFDDARLTKRLKAIVCAVGRDPAASLPSTLSSAELEGAYRFFSNPRVTLEAIMAPHFEATRTRMANEQRVRVIHDQTEFTYRPHGKRRGLGHRTYQGFSGHFSLVVAGDESRKPLGLAGLHTWVRGDTEETEHSYWLKQVEVTAQLLACGARAVHLMDRGAEDYVLLHALLAADHRFVMRVSNRYVTSREHARIRLGELLCAEHVSERRVFLNRRHRIAWEPLRKIHPPREERETTLFFAAEQVVLTRAALTKNNSARLARVPETIRLNAVRIWEPEPPDGEQPVEWFLLTNEPIDTHDDVCAIVDHYRARWTIEEYFKALKTGCAFESRQLQDYEALLNALGVFAPLAYHVLLLRTQARSQPDAPATTVVSSEQIEVLRALGRRELPENPSARDVLLAVAALGGHIKYAPDPGWLTIARGFEKLVWLTAGWMAAKLQPACDQS